MNKHISIDEANAIVADHTADFLAELRGGLTDTFKAARDIQLPSDWQHKAALRKELSSLILKVGRIDRRGNRFKRWGIAPCQMAEIAELEARSNEIRQELAQ